MNACRSDPILALKFLMDLDFIEEITQEAWKNPQEEICGFVVRRAEGMLEALPAKNQHPQPGGDFMIDPQELLEAKKFGRVVGVYHSHPKDPAIASPNDIANSEELKLPYFIFSLVDKRFIAYVPKSMERDPLENRIYIPLVYNCLTLCHDYYQQVLGISLTPLNMELNEDARMNVKLANLIKENNFERMGSPQEGDIVVMNTHDTVPDHTGIYTGHGEILHHCVNRRSERTPYGGLWKKSTCFFLRHKSRI